MIVFITNLVLLYVSIICKGLAHQGDGLAGCVDAGVLRGFDHSHLLEDVFTLL